MTASSIAWTPLFLKAEPHTTGTISPLRVLVLIPAIISSCDKSPFSRYFSNRSSLASAAASINFSLKSWQISIISSGISSSLYVTPRSSSLQLIAFIRIRSTTPLKFSSAPIAIWIGIGFAPNLSLIWETTLRKSAPALSILLTKAILGTEYLFACLHTVSDCGSTPPTAQKTATALSRTLRDLSTSIVKSTCPGVSIMLILCWSNCLSIPCQKQVVAADVIVIPLSCSCSIQSITALPSWTSPILWEIPV